MKKRILSFIMVVVMMMSCFSSETVVVKADNISINEKENFDDKEFIEICIKENPVKLNYVLYDKFDPTGIVIEGVDKDGKKSIITDECEFVGFDSTVVGRKEITVIYEDKMTFFDISVDYAFTYENMDNEIQVTGNKYDISNIVIPKEIDGKKVTSIKSGAFKDNKIICSVILSDSLKKIGEEAFAGCTNIKEIEVPDTVEYIGEGAFRGVPLESLTIPFVGIKKEKETGYFEYTNVFGAIFGHEEKRSMNKSEYATDDTIYQFTYDLGSDSVGYRYIAFSYYIPETLKKVKITNETEIPSNAFYNCKNIEEVSIDDKVTRIGKQAFYKCEKIQSIEIPEGVNEVCEKTFADCTLLKKIQLPDTITQIGVGGFENCTSLKKIQLPDTITQIDANAFKNCKTLQQFILPTKIKKISGNMFAGCEKIEEITLPNSVTKIEEGAFENCKSIKEIEVPDTVEYIGEGAFKGVPLETLAIPFVGIKKEKETGYFEYTNVFGAIFGHEEKRSKDKNEYVTDDTTYQFTYDLGSDSVGYRYIAFSYYIPETLKKVKITNETEIPNNAFYNCRNIEELSIDDKVTKIGESAFYNCQKLKELYLYDSVTNIGKKCFDKCSNIVLYANKDSYTYTYANENNLQLFYTQKVTLNEHNKIMYKGEKESLKACVEMLNGKISENENIKWKSSDEKVVKVNDGNLQVIGPGQAKITASFQGKEDNCLVTVYYKLESIDFDNKNENINVGEKKLLHIQYIPENTTDSKKILWKSSNPNVVSITESGEIQGVSQGVAKVTATSSTGQIAEMEVIVLLPISKIQMSTESLVLQRGEEADLLIKIEPEDATDKCTWYSSNDKIVRVNSDGKVRAVGIGNATIKVVADSGAYSECSISVKAKAQGIRTNVEKIELQEEEIEKLTWTLDPFDSTDYVKCEIENEEIAIISKEGVITALKKGITNVILTTESGIVKKISVKVNPVYHITKMNLLEKDIVLEKNSTHKVVLDVTPKNYTDNIIWSSSNENVASVENGKIIAIAPGQANISAKSNNGVETHCKVNVIEHATDLQVKATKKYINVGDKIQITTIMNPATATDLCAYVSSDNEVVKVDNQGNVLAVGVGSAIITVTTETGLQSVCNINVLEEKCVYSKEELENVLNYSENGKCILLNDLYLEGKLLEIEKSNSLQLDLNGHEIISDDTVIVNNGKLTIKDSSSEQKGKIEIRTQRIAVKTVIENNGEFYLESGVICATAEHNKIELGLDYVYTVINKGYTEIKGGEVIAKMINGYSGRVTGIINSGNANLKLCGGSVNVELNDFKNGEDFATKPTFMVTGVWHNSIGDVVLQGGTINVSVDNRIDIKESIGLVFAVYNNSSGRVKFDGTNICVSNEKKSLGESADFVGIYNESNGEIEIISGKIEIKGNKNFASGVMCVDGVVADIGNEFGKKLEISVQSQDIGVGISCSSSQRKLKLISGTIIAETTTILMDKYENKELIIGQADVENTSNNKINLSVTDKGFVFVAKCINVNEGVFTGRIKGIDDDILIKFKNGYEFSDSDLLKFCTRELKTKTYAIVYKLNGGNNSIENKSEYTVADKNIILKDPTRDGYRFAGWFYDENLSNQCISVTTTTCKDIILYAKWIPENVQVIEKNNFQSEIAKKTTITCKPNKVELKKIKLLKKGKIKFSWKKIRGIAGYEICYYAKGGKKRKKSVLGTTCVLKGLKQNVKYYVSVRAYNREKGKKIYGRWSNIKKVCLKK